MKVNTKGWKREWDRWYSPDGTEYTECRNGERPDVLLHSKKFPGLAPIKLRLWDTSGAARRAKRERKTATKRAAGKVRRKDSLKGIRRTG